MKLRNKKTGKIVDFNYLQTDYISPLLLTVSTNGRPEMFNYYSLAEINEEWEDVPEEPKGYWYIDCDGEIIDNKNEGTGFDKDCKAIGNYFETEEEAEQAVEKLKAWKRLRDKGFKVDLWDYDGANYQEGITTGRILFRVKDYGRLEENDKDLDLLFGGEDGE